MFIACSKLFLSNIYRLPVIIYGTLSILLNAVLRICFSKRSVNFYKHCVLLVRLYLIVWMTFALSLKKSIIGINNRNLKTFATDINNTINLCKKFNLKNRVVISESGINSKKDILHICKKTNIRTFLIGESLIKSNNIKDNYSMTAIRPRYKEDGLVISILESAMKFSKLSDYKNAKKLIDANSPVDSLKAVFETFQENCAIP